MEYLSKARGGKMDSSDLDKLVIKGFITCNDSSNTGTYPFKALTVTHRFIEEFVGEESLIDSSITFEEAFAQLREVYPKTVPNGLGGVRRLHADLKVCESLYRKVICFNGGRVNADLHNSILECIKFEIEERKRSNESRFMVELSRYIRNQRWSTYLEELENRSRIGSVEGGGFQDDI